jgi:hypothetical protein
MHVAGLWTRVVDSKKQALMVDQRKLMMMHNNSISTSAQK